MGRVELESAPPRQEAPSGMKPLDATIRDANEAPLSLRVRLRAESLPRCHLMHVACQLRATGVFSLGVSFSATPT